LRLFECYCFKYGNKVNHNDVDLNSLVFHYKHFNRGGKTDFSTPFVPPRKNTFWSKRRSGLFLYKKISGAVAIGLKNKVNFIAKNSDIE